MPALRGKARPQGVLLLACCALFLRQCLSLRELQGEHAAVAAQRRGVGNLRGSLRGLREVFEDDYDEDEELDSQPTLGTGISRLGIHGEGLGYVSHNLLESDSELIALAAAVKSGDAKATGRGAQSSRNPGSEGKQAQNPAGYEMGSAAMIGADFAICMLMLPQISYATARCMATLCLACDGMSARRL